MHLSFTSHPLARFPFFSFLLLCSLMLMLSGCKSDPQKEPDVEEQESNCSPKIQSDADWASNVYPNCFENIERLGRWSGGTQLLSPTMSPDTFFASVTKGEIKTAKKPIHLYVVTHGWAPGFRASVRKQNFNIKWWSNTATDAEGIWASDWYWTPTKGVSPDLVVSETGLIQQLILQEQTTHPDDSVIVLAYSWIDNSATDSTNGIHVFHNTEVRISEAYTNINGLRLAQAIEQVVATGFMDSSSHNRLHILGHSHGSKVATVAAMELQKAGYKVDQLTTMDPPESYATLTWDAANLLGFYFDSMEIASPTAHQPLPKVNGRIPLLVENYISEFGVAYKGTPQTDNIVNVALYPENIFGTSETGNIADKHAYSATWYAGAAVGARDNGTDSVGMDWPPFPANNNPGWYQSWKGKTPSEENQWKLSLGHAHDAGLSTRVFGGALAVIHADGSTKGHVSGQPDDRLVFRAAAGKATENALYMGKVDLAESGRFGLAFDIKWDGPMDGDYFVVTVESEDTYQEVILVLDGKSVTSGWHQVSFNSDQSVTGLSDTHFQLHFFPIAGNKHGEITFKNFQYITSTER